MIKKERGVLTYMSQEINGVTREDYIAGRNVVVSVDEKLEKALAKDTQEKNDDMER